MEVEPVDEADLGKLFDDMTTREVEVARALLVPAAARLVGLADVYGVRAGWTGAGLELASLPSGQMWIGGFVEPSEVSFYVGLLPPDHYVQGNDLQWHVEAEVSVRCDAANDCGMHRIQTVKEIEADSGVGAVVELVDAVDRLCEVASSQPLEVWRERDTQSGHP